MKTDNGFLHYGRVRLRAMECGDLDWMYELENDTHLWDCSRTSVPYSKHVLRQFIEEAAYDIYRDGQVRLVAELTGEEIPVGCVDLFDFSARHRRAEVGIALLPEFRGKHLGAEVLHSLTDYAFRFLELHQLYAYVACGNSSARRVFEQAGFEYSARLKDWIRVGGNFEDVVLYVMQVPEKAEIADFSCLNE